LERLSEYELSVTLTPEAKRWLAEHGYDPQFGARPLRRAIQRYIESPLSVGILEGKFAAGDDILIDADQEEEELTLSTQTLDVEADVTSGVVG
jgi:ATP-dependent Clp protease ATP-binding subunit ClpA